MRRRYMGYFWYPTDWNVVDILNSILTELANIMLDVIPNRVISKKRKITLVNP